MIYLFFGGSNFRIPPWTNVSLTAPIMILIKWMVWFQSTFLYVVECCMWIDYKENKPNALQHTWGHGVCGHTWHEYVAHGFPFYAWKQTFSLLPRWKYTQTQIHQHRHSTDNKKQKSQNVIRSQYLKYTGHVCRCPNTTLTKKMMFAKSRHDPYKRDPWTNIAKSFKLMSPLSKQRGLHKIRVVLLHLSTM